MPVILNTHMRTIVSAASSKANAIPQVVPPTSIAFQPQPRFRALSPVRAVLPPLPQNSPQNSQPDPWCYDLPMGGDYATILSYFVGKGRPTYRFADLPPQMACVALVCYVVALIPIPAVYLYLDNSLLPQYWYYVYRYILYGLSGVAPSALQQIGIAPNSPGPMTLVLSDKGQTPALAAFGTNLPAPWPNPNPMLAQVSLGNPPVAYAS